MSKVYVVATKRTAIGSFLGTLSPLKPGELGAKVVENIIKETGIDPANIDEVIVGNVLSAGQTQTTRSEERRVGKECRSRWSPYH